MDEDETFLQSRVSNILICCTIYKKICFDEDFTGKERLAQKGILPY